MPELLHPLPTAKKIIPTVSKRIHVIDALRGFTLFGILVTHSSSSFFAVWESSSALGNMGLLDQIIEKNVANLFTNTLYSIFSFLFGLSFAIQLQNALSRKQPFNRKFIWRLTLLLLIGYFHSLFFERDILQLYALLGMLLVLCAKFKNKTLLLLSAVFFTFSVAMQLVSAEVSEIIVTTAESVRTSGFLRLLGLYKLDSQLLSGRLFSTASLFLLGLYVGRQNIFLDKPKNKQLFKKVLYTSGIIVGLGFIGFKWSKISGMPEAYTNAIFAVERMAQSFFYVAVIVKLYQINLFQNILNYLVPAGKMGLTIYIMQSSFIVLLYNLNPSIIIQLGLTAAIGITCVFFIFQMLFAYWWMSRYRYGPLEWVWRSFTHFKWQSIQKPIINTVS